MVRRRSRPRPLKTATLTAPRHSDLLGPLGVSLARGLFWLLIWLGIACATAARADFRGVGNSQIRVTAPDGYCLIRAPDIRYAGLRDGYEQRARKGWVREIFGLCTPPGHRPLKPQIAGYFVALPTSPEVPTPDAWRSRWVKGLRPPPGSDWTEIRTEPANDAAYYFDAIRSPIDFAPVDTRVEATAETIVRNTPVEVTVVRLVGHNDVAGSALALDEAKTLLKATMTRFGQDNGVDFDHPVNEKQAEATVGLSLAAFVDVAGAILMITLAVHRLWVQAAVSAVLGLAGVLIYRAAPGAGVLFGNPVGDIALWSGLAVAFVGVANGVWWLLDRISLHGIGLTSRLRATISVRTWPGAADPQGAAADFTKRWFVTVAAATGSVVMSMLGREGFLNEMAEAFAPNRIIFTLLATVVSVTLIGPIEDSIFGSRMAVAPHEGGVAPSEHEDESSRFEHLLTLFEPRALGRFALVLVFMLMLTVLHGAIEARVHDSKGEDITTMLAASVGPALITYYWCAALQRGVAPVARRAGVAAAVAGLLVLGIPNLIVTIFSAAIVLITRLPWLGGDQPARIWAMMATQGPLELLVSFASLGGFAVAGGMVIDLSMRRRLSPMVTLALVGAALAGVALLFQVVAMGTLAAIRAPDPDRMSLTLSELLAAGGWVIGLIVSGFPTVLRSGAQLTHAPKAD